MAPPVGGYVAWWDASQITGAADGTALSSWSDLSANGNNLAQATGAKQPTYYNTTTANLLNGLPTVWFNASQFMTTSTSITQSQPWTVCLVVFTRTSGAGGSCAFASNSNSVRLNYTFGGQWEMRSGSAFTTTLTPGTTAAHAVITVFNGAASVCSQDGTEQTGNPNTLGLSGPFTLGGNNSGAVYLDGAIGEAIIYPSGLNPTDRASMVTYLTNKWLPSSAVTGTATVSLGPLTLTATGTVSGGTVTGTASLALGPVTVSATGAVIATGGGGVPGPPEWSFQLLQPDGTPIGPLTSATARKLTFPLDGPATAILSMPGDHPETVGVAELATDILVARNGQRLFRGRVGGSSQIAAADSADVNLTAVDYRGMLDHRLFWSSSTLHFAGVDQADIAWQIVADTQALPGGNLGITRGAAAATGVTRDRTYTAGTVVAQAVTDLGDTANGFDWEIDSNLAFNLYHPQRGANGGLVLAYGADIVAATTAVNPGDYANAVYYTGAGGTTPVQSVGTPPAGVGRWDTQKSDSNAAPQQAVDHQAAAALAAASLPRPAFAVTLRPGLWDPATVGLWLGDTVRLIIQTGRLNVDVTRRVVQVDVTLDDNGTETVVLTVGIAPARLSDRINTLTKNVSSVQISTGPGGSSGGGGGGGGGITDIASLDGTVIVTNGTGPTVDLSVPGAGGGTVVTDSAIPFVFTGTLVNSTSPAITPHLTLHAAGLSARLSTTSSATSTVELLKNGTSAATVTIAGGAAYAYTTFTAVTFTARTDSYAIRLTATGGADLGGEIELA